MMIMTKLNREQCEDIFKEAFRLLPYAKHSYCFNDSIDFVDHCRFWQLANDLKERNGWWHYMRLIKVFKTENFHRVWLFNLKPGGQDKITYTDTAIEVDKHQRKTNAQGGEE